MSRPAVHLLSSEWVYCEAIERMQPSRESLIDSVEIVAHHRESLAALTSDFYKVRNKVDECRSRVARAFAALSQAVQACCSLEDEEEEKDLVFATKRPPSCPPRVGQYGSRVASLEEASHDMQTVALERHLVQSTPTATLEKSGRAMQKDDFVRRLVQSRQARPRYDMPIGKLPTKKRQAVRASRVLLMELYVSAIQST